MNAIVLSPTMTHITTETVICDRCDHAHKDSRIDVLRFVVNGHSVEIESERNSGRYNARIDEQAAEFDMTAQELNQFIQEQTK